MRDFSLHPLYFDSKTYHELAVKDPLVGCGATSGADLAMHRPEYSAPSAGPGMRNATKWKSVDGHVIFIPDTFAQKAGFVSLSRS